MSQRWNIDTSHSSVHFTVRHMVISKVRGGFTKWSGTLDFDPEHPEATSIAVKIETASIDTHEAQRDGHLRSPDFFDAEKFPTITFESKKIDRAGDTFRVTGDLAMHGVTKPVTLEAEFLGAGKDPWGNQRAGFTAHGKLDRREFGLQWNQVLEAGGLLVGDTIDIAIDVEAVAQK